MSTSSAGGRTAPWSSCSSGGRGRTRRSARKQRPERGDRLARGRNRTLRSFFLVRAGRNDRPRRLTRKTLHPENTYEENDRRHPAFAIPRHLRLRGEGAGGTRSHGSGPDRPPASLCPGRPRQARAAAAQDPGGPLHPAAGELAAGGARGVQGDLLLRRARPGALGVPVAEPHHHRHPRRGDDHLVPRPEACRDPEGGALLGPGLQVPRGERQPADAPRVLHGEAQAAREEGGRLPPGAGAQVPAHRQAAQGDDPVDRRRHLLPLPAPVHRGGRRHGRVPVQRHEEERPHPRRPFRAEAPSRTSRPGS